jgi:lipid A 4'-phosphatase
MQSIAATRRYWLPQLVLLVILAVLGTLPFWLTDLDLRLAAAFYHPAADDPWYQAQEPLWLLLYQLAPMLSGLVMIGSLAVLAVSGLVARWRRLRIYAVFVIAVSLLGPGLLVNGLFKEHWGRPRPHQLTEFGGTKAYLPPLVPGQSGEGKAFPCGHSSVGFALVAFVLIWLRRRPRLAAAALGATLAVGGLLGAGRIVAGDHFLSDVIWSGVMVYAVALGLYYFVMRIPQREDALALESPAATELVRHPRLALAAYVILGAGMLTAVLLATPLNQNEVEKFRPGDAASPPRVLTVTVDDAEVILHPMVGADGVTAELRLRGRGFGLPGGRLEQTRQVNGEALEYRIWHRGIFTERDAQVLVGVVPGAWDRIVVRAERGDIQAMHAALLAPILDLETASGAVVRP